MKAVSYQLLYYLCIILPLIAGLGMIVTGVMITAGKEKSVKVLGIGFMIEGVGRLLSGASTVFARMGSVKMFASYSVGANIASALCIAAGLVCMCIFIHKNYGKKLIYIPVLSIQAGGWIINRIVVLLLFKTNIRSNAAVWISMTQIINNFVISAAVTVIIIVVLFKNRNNEKVIPQAWLCKSIALAGNFMGLLFNCAYYLSILMRMKIRSSDVTISLIVAAFNLVCLILPIYTTVMVYSKKKEPAQV